MSDPTEIEVEVVYAEPDRQWRIRVTLPAGSNVGDALSAARPELPEAAEIVPDRIGIFGAACGVERTLAAGDRVEIYRPLLVDAKSARRARAVEQRYSRGLKRD